MFARSRPSPIDSIVTVLAALTSIMVLVVVVSLGLQGRLGDDTTTAPSINDGGPASARLEFDDLLNPVSIQCQLAPDANGGPELFSVTIENRSSETRNYDVLVELLPAEGAPVEGYASVSAIQPLQQSTAAISLMSQPGVSATLDSFSACRVRALESQRQILRAD